MSDISILDLSQNIETHWNDYTGAIEEVLRSGMFINGPAVKNFEKEVASYLNVKHAIGVNSGTDALVIALRAMDLKPGDEVIVPSFTFYATAESVSAVGATPVFVDICESDFNMDPETLKGALTERTRGIIPVHLFGQTANMEKVQQFATDHGLFVLEDVAQAFGADFKGKKCGSMGTAGAFSFFPSKNLGAFGDGGLITTDDDKVAELSLKLRSHGSIKKYHNELVGYNSRLDSMQAAILRVKLNHIDEANQGRLAAANRYNEALGKHDEIETPEMNGFGTHVFHQYTVRIKNGKRDSVREKLQADGIGTMVYYPVPCHKLKVYEGNTQRLSRTESAAEEVLSLPIWPEISTDIQLRVTESLIRALS